MVTDPFVRMRSQSVKPDPTAGASQPSASRISWSRELTLIPDPACPADMLLEVVTKHGRSRRSTVLHHRRQTQIRPTRRLCGWTRVGRVRVVESDRPLVIGEGEGQRRDGERRSAVVPQRSAMSFTTHTRAARDSRVGQPSSKVDDPGDGEIPERQGRGER